MELRQEPAEELRDIVDTLDQIDGAVKELKGAAEADEVASEEQNARAEHPAYVRLEGLVHHLMDQTSGRAAEWLEQVADGDSPSAALIGGAVMLDVAVACDLAAVAEDLDPSDGPSLPVDPEIDPDVSAIQAIAGDLSIDQAAVISLMSSAFTPGLLGRPPRLQNGHDVLRETVDATTRVSTLLLKTVIPWTGETTDAVVGGIWAMIDALPTPIHDAAHWLASRLRALAGQIIEHAQNLLRMIPGPATALLKQFLMFIGAGNAVMKSIVRGPIAWALGEDHIEDVILRSPNNPNPDELDRIRVQHQAWVAKPVPGVTRWLWLLKPLHAHGVPAVPIVAGLLLTWTLIASSDQLGSPGSFTDFWQPDLRGLYL